MLTDSHCHLASHKFTASELPDIVARACNAGVSRMISIATDLTDSRTNLEIAERFPEVFAALGIHPCDVHETPDDFLPSLREMAQHPRCVAIGETGLDYFHPAPAGWTAETYHQRQRDFLRQHFALAAELNKNIIIHTRDQHGKQSLDDALAIYRDFASQVRAVFHCFLGPWENASEIISLGGAISFTGIATFKGAKDCLAAAIAAPAGSFMLETDSPYLAPTPHRGQRCEPAFTRLTAEAIAAARGESLAELALHTQQCCDDFFHFATAVK